MYNCTANKKDRHQQKIRTLKHQISGLRQQLSFTLFCFVYLFLISSTSSSACLYPLSSLLCLCFCCFVSLSVLSCSLSLFLSCVSPLHSAFAVVLMHCLDISDLKLNSHLNTIIVGPISDGNK